MLQGDAAAARALHTEVLDQRLGSVTSPRDRHSLAGWCCYRIGDLERAADHLVRATSIDVPQASGDRLDLGLVFLAGGATSLAQKEYKHALKELRHKPGDPLRRRALLKVGLVDLQEAIQRGGVTFRREAEAIRSDLEEEITACAPALDLIRPFLTHADEAARQAPQDDSSH